MTYFPFELRSIKFFDTFHCIILFKLDGLFLVKIRTPLDSLKYRSYFAINCNHLNNNITRTSERMILILRRQCVLVVCCCKHLIKRRPLFNNNLLSVFSAVFELFLVPLYPFAVIKGFLRHVPFDIHIACAAMWLFSGHAHTHCTIYRVSLRRCLDVMFL